MAGEFKERGKELVRLARKADREEREFRKEANEAARAGRMDAARQAASNAEKAHREFESWFEELYRILHPATLRLCRHLARNNSDAEEIEQIGWVSFTRWVREKDKPEYWGLLLTIMRHAMIDYYGRRIDLPLGDHDIPTPPPKPPEPPPCVYAALLECAAGKQAGPVHERIAFFFNKILDVTPQTYVRDHSPERHSKLLQAVEDGYVERSALPEQLVRAAFAGMWGETRERLRTNQPKTADEFPAVANLLVGDTCPHDYFTSPNQTDRVSKWVDNVRRRVARCPARNPELARFRD